LQSREALDPVFADLNKYNATSRTVPHSRRRSHGLASVSLRDS